MRGLYTKTGSIFIAIDPAIFRPLAGFVNASDHFPNKLKTIPAAPGFKEVYVPGEPEQRSRSLRINEGIPPPEGSWQTLQQQVVKYGVDLDSVAKRRAS